MPPVYQGDPAAVLSTDGMFIAGVTAVLLAALL
jgi:hypothetical protein